ncbi:TonB-dependent receptor [Flavobacterium sp. N3904]|uniref:TonB-dependent receptor n=1 Tax=Flavobacterium sp. N3904 TaxID=2986835 RepID=UPI00222586D1|nr:TonB-dependent receptor [Flavobacterium sp. N3904]
MKNLFSLKGINAKTIQLSKRFLFSIFFSLFSLFSFSQTKDTTKVNQLDEVLVSAIRVTSKTPVTFSNLDKKDIKFRNLGQDIPILMNYLPSVVTTSDAGNGIGYTGIRVRGSDATRVNVTINGIPYNDSESQGTYWVNMPDFASSLQSLQLQRGVGTSTNGVGAFGASLNMLTDNFANESNGEISGSAGSFNTYKKNIKFSTGLLNEHIEISGRLSTIDSQGYIDRAESNLQSYFLQTAYVGKSTLIKALVFGGHEKTYQSWNGIDPATMESNRTSNSAGMYTDELGNARFYDNETDNYTQNHYQLLWSEKINENWSSNFALHYTKGKGYYENYKYDEPVKGYGGISPTKIVKNSEGKLVPGTDLVRQKWLDNDFYGTTFSVNYKKEKWDAILGGGWNKYVGDHYGTVIWARYASQSELGDRYYDDTATKTDGNIFLKASYQLTEKFSLFGDLQYRNVHYVADGVQPTLVDETYHFFNPKAGITYTINPKNNLYFSYARANREPNRTDFEGGNAKPEKLNDYELGWRFVAEKLQFNTNLYYMGYKDQLILTGQLDDVGSPIRSNSETSYRTGLEVDVTIPVTEKFMIKPNFTLSSNKNVNLTVNAIDYGTTDIAYSPDVIVGNIFIYKPIESVYISLLQKFVGEQYMNNIESPEAKLPSYFVNDLNVAYTFTPKKIFKAIVINALVNNILDKKYVSNGYMYDVYPYYYPQAGINFLAGLTLKF